MRGRDQADTTKPHIPGARFFTIDEISVGSAVGHAPHLLHACGKVHVAMRALGVGDGHQVVIMTGQAVAAARVGLAVSLDGAGKCRAGVCVPKMCPTEDMAADPARPFQHDRAVSRQPAGRDVTPGGTSSKLQGTTNR